MSIYLVNASGTDPVDRSFLGQVPIFVAAVILCWIVLPPLKHDNSPGPSTKLTSKLGRIDFAGAALLGLGILSLMLPLEIGGAKLPWSHPAIICLFVAGSLLLGLFLIVEKYWAREPIFPVRLMYNRNVVLCYFIGGCQMAAQMTVGKLLSLLNIALN